MHRFLVSKNRLEGFSDGVFAIIITLMVFEIRIPDLEDPYSNSEALSVFLRLIPSFLGFLMSFALVSILWLQHHYIFSFVRKVDWGLTFCNMGFLFFLCMIVTPSGFIGEYPLNAVGMAVFTGIFLGAHISLQVVWVYAYKRGLLSSSVRREDLVSYLKQRALGVVLHFLALLAVLLHPLVSWGTLMIILLYYTIPKWVYLLESKPAELD